MTPLPRFPVGPSHIGDQSQATQSDRGSCCLVGPRGQEGFSCPPCAPSLPASLAGTRSLGPFHIPDVARHGETDAANFRAGTAGHLRPRLPALGSMAAAGGWAPWSAWILSGFLVCDSGLGRL